MTHVCMYVCTSWHCDLLSPSIRSISGLKIRDNFRVYLECAHQAFLTTLVVLVLIDEIEKKHFFILRHKTTVFWSDGHWFVSDWNMIEEVEFCCAGAKLQSMVWSNKIYLGYWNIGSVAALSTVHQINVN